MILDARDIYGVEADQIEALWDDLLARKGLIRRTHHDIEVQAYVNKGRWVADCPAGGCGGAMGAYIGRGTGCCLTCGTEVTVKFPATKERTEAVALLEQQPPHLCDWDRHKGETVAGLRLRCVAADAAALGVR